MRCIFHIIFPCNIFQTFKGVCKSQFGNQSCRAMVIPNFMTIDNKKDFRRVILKTISLAVVCGTNKLIYIYGPMYQICHLVVLDITTAI